MKSYKQLIDRFRNMNMSTREWCEKTKFPRSRATADYVFNQGKRVEPSSMVYLAFCLGFSNAEIVAILDSYLSEVSDYAAEIKILKKLIWPVMITDEDQTLLARVNKLDAKKKRVIMDMLETMEG